MTTIRDALHRGAARLQPAGIDNPRLEARLLLAHALGLDVPGLLRRSQNSVVEAAGYDTLLSRRVAREPLALIVGRREFWSLDFAVSPATLIPRPDSETLIEAALAALADAAPATDPCLPGHDGAGDGVPSPRRVLDLGTGTGCLLLAALSELSGAFGVGVDRSPAAAALAACNAAMLGMAGRTAFLCGDWATAVDGGFDLILCNPPYIATEELERLMPDIASYEPALALDGGADGYHAYRAVIPELGRLLAAGGIAVLEVGQGQAETVASLALQAGFAPEAHRDLSGIMRALVLRRA